MADRFHIYFTEDEAPLLEEAKRQIDNLSEFFKNVLREHLQMAKPPDTPTDVLRPEVQRPDAETIFRKKFDDFKTEAAVRIVFEDRTGAEQALKNRLAELRRAYPAEFEEIKELFKARYPGYAKILEEL